MLGKTVLHRRSISKIIGKFVHRFLSSGHSAQCLFLGCFSITVYVDWTGLPFSTHIFFSGTCCRWQTLGVTGVSLVCKRKIYSPFVSALTPARGTGY